MAGSGIPIVPSNTDKLLQRFTSIFEYAKAVISVLDLDELLLKTAGVITKITGSKGCLIRINEDGQLKIKYYMGITDGFINILDNKTGMIIPQYVSKSGQSLLIEDTSKLPDGLPVQLKVMRLMSRSILCVPLKKDSVVIGTIELFDKEESANQSYFNDSDILTAEGLAALASLSIDKTRLYQKEKEQEEIAKRAKTKLEAVFNSVTAAIITIDKDYKITSVNNHMSSWTNISIDQLLGRNCRNVFSAPGAISPQEAAKLTFETGHINTVTFADIDRYAELTSYPIFEYGDIIECIILIRDITERTLYEKKIVTLYNEVTQSKERLESLVHDSADAIITTDRDGVITSWNDSAERIYGFSKDEALGQKFPVAPYTGSDQDLVRHLLDGETAKPQIALKDIEVISKNKDGDIINTSLTLSPMRNTSRQINGVSIIARDITRRKKIELELVRSNLESARLYEQVSLAEQELKNIFESISDLVYIIDCGYNIQKVNKSVCDLVGLEMDEIVGKKCYEVFHNTDKVWEKCLAIKTLENKKSYICEVDSFYYNGNDTYGMSNSPIIDTDGNIKGTVNIVRNTTELKKLTAQLASFEKMAMLGEVAAGVAHSIRNPLASIGGFAKRLNQKLDPPYSEYANIIQKEAGRLEELLKKTLGFVHNAHASMDTVDLNTLLATLIHLTVKDPNIVIDEDIPKELIEIIGDAGRLKDAISHIIKNAVQSLDILGNDPKPCVKIRLYKDNVCSLSDAPYIEYAVIEIEDNGIGFKKEAIKYIYDPFYTTKPEGTGLGLAIAHKIILQHLGTIDVSSILGKGTIFTIKIPLKEV